MTDYEKLLQLIEGNPTGDAELYEIDVRFWCYINDKKIIQHPVTIKTPGIDADDYYRDGFYYEKCASCQDKNFQRLYSDCLYHESRDALKAVRDEHLPGWLMIILNLRESQWCIILSKAMHQATANNLATEELAELHAIVQAIEWTRNNDRES